MPAATSEGWTHGDYINLAVAIGTIALASFAFWQIIAATRSLPKLHLRVDAESLHTTLEAGDRLPWIHSRHPDERT